MNDEKLRVEETNKETKEAVEEVKEKKGFTAYLEIYGRSKMLAKVFRGFTGDPDKLDDDDLIDISDYLTNISGIEEEVISHTLLKIVPDEMYIGYDDEDEDEDEDEEIEEK